MKPGVKFIQAQRPLLPAPSTRIARRHDLAAPFRAACWLCALAAAVPFLPTDLAVVAGLIGAQILGIILLVLAIVLFVRGAVARGILTLVLGSLACAWLVAGPAFLLLLAAGADL